MVRGKRWPARRCVSGVSTVRARCGRGVGVARALPAGTHTQRRSNRGATEALCGGSGGTLQRCRCRCAWSQPSTSTTLSTASTHSGSLLSSCTTYVPRAGWLSFGQLALRRLPSSLGRPRLRPGTASSLCFCFSTECTTSTSITSPSRGHSQPTGGGGWLCIQLVACGSPDAGAGAAGAAAGAAARAGAGAEASLGCRRRCPGSE